MIFEIKSVTLNDAKLLFDWANDSLTRSNSFSSAPIKWDKHVEWLQNRINKAKDFTYLFLLDKNPIGVVRFDVSEVTIIGITISPLYRGKGYGSEILKKACNKFFEQNNNDILAYIKKENYSSQKVFEKAGFVFQKMAVLNGIECMSYIKFNRVI